MYPFIDCAHPLTNQTLWKVKKTWDRSVDDLVINQCLVDHKRILTDIKEKQGGDKKGNAYKIQTLTSVERNAAISQFSDEIKLGHLTTKSSDAQKEKIIIRVAKRIGTNLFDDLREILDDVLARYGGRMFTGGTNDTAANDDAEIQNPKKPIKGLDIDDDDDDSSDEKTGGYSSRPSSRLVCF